MNQEEEALLAAIAKICSTENGITLLKRVGLMPDSVIDFLVGKNTDEIDEYYRRLIIKRFKEAEFD